MAMAGLGVRMTIHDLARVAREVDGAKPTALGRLKIEPRQAELGESIEMSSRPARE
jgi:hypothetical protein